MLDDRNFIAEENRVDGAAAIGGVIDVIGVDADQFGTGIGKMARCIFGEERMAFEVGVCAPMAIPAGLNEDRFAAYVEPGEGVAGDGAFR